VIDVPAFCASASADRKLCATDFATEADHYAPVDRVIAV
jgi:hypothetical protein